MVTFPSITGVNRQNDLPFGDLAAEKDKLLISSFVDLGYMGSIQDGSTSLLTGPKGAGKSAIVRYFMVKNEHNLFVSLYEKNRFEGLFNYLHVENRSIHIIDAIFEIFLLITAVESLAKDHSLFGNSIWQTIEKSLNELNIQFSVNRKASERKFEVNIIKIFTKLSLTTKIENQSMTLAHLQQISRIFKTSIEELTISNKHIVFLDNLDENYSKISFQEFQQALISLIMISDQLNSLNPNLHFVTLLRDDILRRLYDANLGKIVARSKHLSWGNTTEEVTEKFGVFIEKRLITIAPQTRYHSKDGWGMFFEECYGRAAEPWQNLNPEKLIEKSMWRPRDILEFMNAMYINFKDIDPQSKKLDTLKQASFNTEKTYSEYFLRELTDAAHTEINEIIDFNTLIREYKKLKRPSYTILEWNQQIGKKFALSEDKSIRILEILFDHSAIGIYSPSHGQKWAFRGHHGEFDSDSTILTHQGLFKVLGFYF